MVLARNDKIKLALLLGLWFLVFYPVVPEMVRDWAGHSDNNHGFLVPLIALYLIWQKKDELLSAEIDSSKWGAVVLVAGLAVFLLSFAGGVAFPARVAMVLSLFGLLWFCTGSAWGRILAFPVLFLLFMVPVPVSVIGLVSMPLQLMATKVSAKLIEHCSIPVYREGNMLFFVGTQLEVAEACSGVRSIMSLTMLGTIFAYMSQATWKRRVVMVLAAVPIAMTANIIRITGTGILAHFFGDKVARGFLHEFSGIIVFVFGLAVLGGLYKLLNRKKVA
ncbi:exosortase/archaeosortase family protein [Geomonas terrae]|uniref:Exosortase/archaeosortase family protein n=1 Tax=Geomonas terrae TaxID=2562681 RepID=A0A4V3NZ61_9BACT|nr:exosortase A [Geomonas terrae]TGU70462.1 exosortase/archaeosortase family protein [Geomonas terrae]TGU72882.1 exosortase/archaeosortase family protein [Geomonas terrae]